MASTRRKLLTLNTNESSKKQQAGNVADDPLKVFVLSMPDCAKREQACSTQRLLDRPDLF
jgi:hypothetical protein